MNSQSGWLKWVIILVIIAVVVWLFVGRGENTDVENGENEAAAALDGATATQ